MSRRRHAAHQGEAGYSLIEVLAAILILTIAIIPMVKMFDVGLQAATLGSNYDGARSLAKKHVETVQNLTYDKVRSSMPNAPCTFDASGLCVSSNRQDTSGSFNHFRYEIRKQFVKPNAAGTGFTNHNESTGLMKVTITVDWGGPSFDQKSYTTTVLKSK